MATRRPNRPSTPSPRWCPATLRALHALEFAGAPSLAAHPAADHRGPGRPQRRSRRRPRRLARARLAGAAGAGARSAGACGRRRPAKASPGLLAAPEAPQPIVAAYRALRTYAARRRGALSDVAASEARQPVLSRAGRARRRRPAGAPGRRRSDARGGRRHACRRPVRHARRLLALRAGILRPVAQPGRWSWRCMAAAAMAAPSCGAGCARRARAASSCWRRRPSARPGR